MKICGLNPEEEMLGGNRNRDRLLRYINEGEKYILKTYQKLMKLLKESKKKK